MEVFISYETTTGLEYASHVKKALKKINISAFVADEDIPEGTKWQSIIDEAIINCKHFVVVMTMGAILSPDEIKPEIELASQLHKNIIPCKRRNIDRMLTRTLPLVYELQQVDFDDKEELAEQILTIIHERMVGRTNIDEAAETELRNVQTAVIAMMVDNNLTSLPNPVTVATNDMGAFPDATSACGINKIADPKGNAYHADDKDGYILYQHDLKGDGTQTELVNYLAKRYIKGTYIVDSHGTVTQITTGYE